MEHKPSKPLLKFLLVDSGLHCFGDGFYQVARNSSRIAQNFSCPKSECTGQRIICTEHANLVSNCLWLSSRKVHVFQFQNGSLLQTPPVSLNLTEDCSPQYAYQSNVVSQRIWIQCRSLGPTNFYPLYNQFDLYEGGWELTGRVDYRTGLYANISTNSIIAGGRWNGQPIDFVVSIKRGSPAEVLIHPEPNSDPHSISLETECDTITTLHRSEPVDSLLQFVVDCVKSGRNKRFVLTLNSDLLDNGVQRFELIHTSGIVKVTPDKNYFLIEDQSQIILINRSNLHALEAVKNFSTVIDTLPLSDELILIESPGLDRVVLNVTEFVATHAQNGFHTLPESAAYCPVGLCPPSLLVQDRFIVVSVRSNSYFRFLAYDIENLDYEPFEIGLLLTQNFPQICFFDGDPPVPNQNTSPTPSIPTKDIHTATSITTGTSSSSETSVGKIVGPILGAIALAAFVGIIMISILIKVLRKSPDNKRLVFSPDLSHTSKDLDTKENSELKPTEVPLTADIRIESEDNSFSTQASSRIPSPMTLPTEDQHTMQHLTVSIEPERTSDYHSDSSQVSTPQHSNTPVPPHRHASDDEILEGTTEAIVQQDGTNKPEHTAMVAPKLQFSHQQRHAAVSSSNVLPFQATEGNQNTQNSEFVIHRK